METYEKQLEQVTLSLAEFKHRALTAELQLEETSSNSSKVEELEKKLKEKTVLNDKLRHEGVIFTTFLMFTTNNDIAVIMNEHLMEALRRLRRTSNDTNVDRRLVTNILLQFLNTPRADSKRFEMLSLLSTILQWDDDEREKAGLQRSGATPSTATSLWGRATTPSSAKGQTPQLEKTDETEVRLPSSPLSDYHFLHLNPKMNNHSNCSNHISPSLVYGSNSSSQKPQQAMELLHHLNHPALVQITLCRERQRDLHHISPPTRSSLGVDYLRLLPLRWPVHRIWLYSRPRGRERRKRWT